MLSSSKSIRTFAVRPLPLTSEIVPLPNLACLTRAPTSISGVSWESSLSSANAAGAFP